jgi:thiamine-monophosphate kinase
LFEFDLIRQYFLNQPVHRSDVHLGVGDDAAIVAPKPGMELVVAADVINEGIHFPIGTDPAAIGHKVLAVNLSDMAAMGAEPAWFTMTLSLPETSHQWLDAFCTGLYQLAKDYQLQLIGGDTVQGPLSVAVQIGGYVPEGKALLRSGAQAGDRIYVTGTLGDAAAALAIINNKVELGQTAADELRSKLDYPRPQVAAGLQLRGRANSAIDISDGLVSDLGHILESSHCGARINIDTVPVSDCFRLYCQHGGDMQQAIQFGDDYELCFTTSADESQVNEWLKGCDCTATCVGEIVTGSGLVVVDHSGSAINMSSSGFEHFRK